MHKCHNIYIFINILPLLIRSQLTDNQIHTIEKNALQDLVSLERL